MRYEKSILDGWPRIFSRDDFLDFYGDIDGAARWERAAVYDSDDSSDSSGCPEPELRHDEATGFGPGYFFRDNFLDHYGSLDGAARWERAAVCDPDDGADGSDDGADDADSSDGDGVFPDGIGYGREPPTTAPLPFGGYQALDPISGCRAANLGRAGIPRACLVCGETAPSGKSFFANHLNAAYECPYTRASPSDSSGAGSGPRTDGSD